MKKPKIRFYVELNVSVYDDLEQFVELLNELTSISRRLSVKHLSRIQREVTAGLVKKGAWM